MVFLLLASIGFLLMMEHLQIQGISNTYEIKASDAGNEIQFQVVVTDNLGNIENGILYELQIAETSTDDTNTSTIPITLIPETSYPNDTEIQTLLPEAEYSYKWGNEVGTAPTLSYSFSYSGSFVMNAKYTEDFIEYEMDPDAINNMLSVTGYELKTFSENEKNVFRDALSDWGDASGIAFVEVDDTNEVYGELRFHLLDFSLWKNIDSIFDSGGFAFSHGPMMS